MKLERQGRRLRHGRRCRGPGHGRDGRIDAAGVALTAVGETAFAATDAEAVARRAPRPTRRPSGPRADAAAGQARPVSDSHGPVDYKLAMVREITTRALRLAASRALGAAS